MAISEESRHHLYQRLETVLGANEAATLMEHLPPVGWADVATKRDLDALQAATRRDIAELRAETTRNIGELEAATTREFAASRAEMSSMEHRLRSDLIAHLERELRGQTWRMLTAVVAMSSLIVAAPHL